MKPWYFEDPARLQRERDEIAKLEASSPWLSGGTWVNLEGDLAYEFDMTVGERVYEGRLVYPDLFPDAPAWIVPRKDGESWSGHQFVSGTLCLEHRPDTWHPEVTGAMVIKSAHELLSIEKPGPGIEPRTAPSAHRTTQAERLRDSKRRGVFSVEGMKFLNALPLGSRARLTFSMPAESVVLRPVLSAVERNGSQVRLDDVPDFNAFKTLRTIDYDGYAFRVDGQVPSFASNIELLMYLVTHGFVEKLPPDGTEKVYFAAFVDGDGIRRLFLATTDPDGEPSEYAVIVSEEPQRRLPTSMSKVVRKRVAIIGCGSVGSKIAASLARSGVKQFLLVDHDILRPENLVRNELDWYQVGSHKVHALRDRLNMIAGGIVVEVMENAAGSAMSSRYMSAAYEQIGSCDLIIDATARSLVFVRLAGIARRRGKPLVWGELFAGGMGGLVARSRPNVDAPALEVRTAMLAHLATLPEAPYRGAVDYDDIDSIEPLVGLDAEVAFLASIMTLLSLDVLAESEPSRFPYSAYRFGLRAKWAFDGPFEFVPIETPSPARAASSPPDPTAALEAAEFMLSLDAQT